ncbi:MAG: DNA-binding GntR family transcriptional regulator, partial [Colwellia sp.]
MIEHINDLPRGENIIANDIELTKLLNISRTTLRAYVERLCETGLI